MKYCPAWPGHFDTLEAARAWCTEFFDYYNHQHRHRNLGLHTPASVHHGTAPEIRAQRAITLTEAFCDSGTWVRIEGLGSIDTLFMRNDEENPEWQAATTLH